MIDPIFWLGLSILLVAVSVTALLVAALPAIQEVARAARSAEKLFDTLRRDLPPTLEAIRLTGLEITDLTDDVSDGVKSAGQVVKKVDQSLDTAKKQAQKVQITTKSVFVGVKAAWRSFTRTSFNRRSAERLPPNSRRAFQSRREAASEENLAPEPLAYDNHDIQRQASSNYSDDSYDVQHPEDFDQVDSDKTK